jgi:hypothetical protein
MNILRHKNGYIGNTKIVYCGRLKSNKQWKLGNPFSWKRSQARWLVKDLKECLDKFKLFTWDLINERWNKFNPEDIEFAQQYWTQMKSLANQIKQGEVDALTCFCGEWKNFTPVKGVPYECHTQILYAACLYMIEKEIV